MPKSNGRPGNRKPHTQRIYMRSEEFSGYVTTLPWRKDAQGKTERVPNLTVERIAVALHRRLRGSRRTPEAK